MPSLSTSLLEAWYSALREGGLRLRVTSGTRETLRAKLYAARAEVEDPNLASLSIVFPPNDLDQVWLVLRSSNGAPS